MASFISNKLYGNATGASEISNLAYADRLGLWRGGDGSFTSRSRFITTITSGGIASMEVVSRDMKALGLYTARSLSYAGTEVSILEHNLTEEQTKIYDTYALAYQQIHQHLHEALAMTHGQDSSDLKKNTMSLFEGGKQRFFSHLLTSMKSISVIKDMEIQLAKGNACVIQIVSTSESLLKQKLLSIPKEEYDDLRLDITPRDYILEYLDNSFPVYNYNVYTEENVVKAILIKDENGDPMINKTAVQLKENMVNKILSLPPIPSALDQILYHFGKEKVAEVTGRMIRLIKEDGCLKVETRSNGSNTVETNKFMDDEKQILIFSKAGGTGRSYHADLGRNNKRRRIHYLLEAGWKADEAIQGLGRSHRTNQAIPPMFRPVASNVKGEKRFLATIAKRLDSMGAITKGERKSGSQGMFREEDNLETDYAKKALKIFFDEIYYKGENAVLTLEELGSKMGLNLNNSDGSKKETLPPMTQFLNRMLAIEIDLQNALFTRFDDIHQGLINDAKMKGVFEIGVSDFKGDSIELTETHEVYQHARTSSNTQLKMFKIRNKVKKYSSSNILEKHKSRGNVGFYTNNLSGKVCLCFTNGSVIDMSTGDSTKQIKIVRPNNGAENVAEDIFKIRYTRQSETKGCKLWDEVSQNPIVH